MQCLQCQHENPEGARFCNSCGATQQATCPACGHINPSESRFCNTCGYTLFETASPHTQPQPQQTTPDEPLPAELYTRDAERRQLTVMFCDLVDSTRLSGQLDPEDLREVVRAYQHTCAEVIQRYDGYIAQYLGDGLLVYFGYPMAHEDDAQRAVRTGLEIVDAMGMANTHLKAGYNVQLAVRLGIHTGPVVVGEMGGSGRQEHLALGETPNIAARLESLAPSDSVVISGTTRRLVQDYFDCQTLGAQQAKGVNAPIDLYRVLGRRGVQSRFEAISATGLTSLVGRERDLALLQERLTETQTGSGQVVILVGEAGIGKSRLLHEFRQQTDTMAARWLVGRCVSYGQGIAYLPVLDIVRELFGLQETDDVTTLRSKMEAGVQTLGDSFTWTVPFLYDLLALDPGDDEVRTMNPGHRRGRLLEALRALLVGSSQRQPLVILVEDLHWMDPHSEEVIRVLLESIAVTPVLVLLSYRPGYTAPFGDQTYYTRLNLHRLPDPQMQAMVANVLGSTEVPAAVQELIVRKAEGNPLFIEELSKALVEDGTLQSVRGGYRLVRQLDEVSIPDTVQGVIMSRIDRLPEAAKAALQIAAVVGREFTARLVERVAALGSDAAAQLGELRAVELIYEKAVVPELTYLFKHALTHDVAYDSLLRQHRRALHRQVGAAIEALYAERLPEFYETLAWHYVQGEAWPKAVAYLLQAADQARSRYAYADATRYSIEAIAILDQFDEASDETVRAYEGLGDLESLQDQLELANQAYDRAMALADTPGTQRRIANKRHRPYTVHRDGARIAFYEHGSGDDTLVLSNPLLYGLSTFQPVLEQLCHEFRMITIDSRGTGASDPLPRPYTLNDHMEDVRAVVAACTSGPIVGVGISKGGNTLTKLAVTYPSLVQKLVLVATPLDDLAPGVLFPLRGDWVEEFTDALKQRDLERALPIFFSNLCSDPGGRNLAEQFVQTCLRLEPGPLLGFFARDSEVDIVPLLGQIQIPTLVMHGTADRLVSFEAGRYLVEHIPEAQFYAFAGRGHWPTHTATSEFCEVLRSFVRTDRIPETSRSSP